MLDLHRLKLLRELDASDERRDTIAAAAEGNPLFLEQLAAMAAERPGSELGVPPSIYAVLAARLDQLDVAVVEQLDLPAFPSSRPLHPN